jgi:hypothetical protein
MDSGFLSSSYARYKEDTQRVATWLACTAKRYGYVEQTPKHNTDKATGSGRLKGKARKEARLEAQSSRSRVGARESKLKHTVLRILISC